MHKIERTMDLSTEFIALSRDPWWYDSTVDNFVKSVTLELDQKICNDKYSALDNICIYMKRFNDLKDDSRFYKMWHGSLAWAMNTMVQS